MEYTKENLEKIIRDIAPDLIGAYAKNFRETVLQENVPKFAKGTELSQQSIYNFENGSNVSYNTFYEYVKRGFLTYIFG
jgi:hypothetical protein